VHSIKVSQLLSHSFSRLSGEPPLLSQKMPAPRAGSTCSKQSKQVHLHQRPMGQLRPHASVPPADAGNAQLSVGKPRGRDRQTLQCQALTPIFMLAFSAMSFPVATSPG
jgi:hypothetical protein